MKVDIVYTTLPYDEIYTKIWKESHSGTYVSYLRGGRCQTDEEFFREISASFQFPKYFGNNWNALNDCLCDLDWLRFTKIFIVLDDFEYAFQRDPEGKALILKSLTFMIRDWQTKNTEVEVWLNN